MKKVLLGTSALVGATLLAGGAANAMPIQSYADSGDPILTASIVMQFEAGIADNSDAKALGLVNGTRDGRFVSGRFAEIWFQGEMTADNGLTYGARISLAADTPTRTNTFPGRKYIYFSGGWGSIEMGDWLGANSTLSTTPIAKEVAGNGTFDHAFSEYFIAPNTAVSGRPDFIFANGNYRGWFDFGTKISYYTPVFSGFQAGISYSPTSDNVGTSLSNRGNALNGGAAVTNNGGFKDMIGVGARWDGDLGPVGVGVSWVGLFGDADTAAACGFATGVNCATVQREDMKSWEVGGKLTYAGFAAAVAYFDDGASGAAVGTQSDAHGISATLNYSFGPAIVGVSFTRQKNEHNARAGAVGVEDYRFRGIGLTAGYTIATGLKWYADILHADFEGPTNANDADGWTGYTGFYVSF